jgi:hypothetical protein
MSDNPWMSLPHSPPFVLHEDEEAVRQFNAQAAEDHRIRTDELLPEPFVGDPAAPVLLLSNNPGYGKRAALRQQPEFMARMRDGICLKVSTYPFVYLHPDLREAGHWWRQKLKCLFQRFGEEVVSRSVCNVVYFPYPSKRYAHGDCELWSQRYSFGLVRASVERGAVIVLMRKGQLGRWQEKISEVEGYRNLIILHNPRMPAVSPRNCDPGDYDKVVRAIEEAEMKCGQRTADGPAHLVH